MSGAVFDSVILIDSLNGNHEARDRLKQTNERAISVITRTEVLAGVRSDMDHTSAIAALSSCENIPVTNEIADLAADLRKQYKLKTADAIIYATARALGVSLVTWDKAFPDETDVVQVKEAPV